MRLSAVIAVFAALPFSLADVEITKPDADTEWTGGTTVEMEWKDSGEAPSLGDFSTFTVYLCWGSNDAPLCDYALSPAGAKFSAQTKSTKFPLPQSVGEDGKVYFLKMETVALKGGFTWNYSPRFALTDMTGTFTAAALAEQKKGDTDPPERKDTTTDEAVPQDGGASMAKVPYTMQTGPTRYAPMQTQPGKKITAKSASRQYPTSSYSIFKTKGPKPNIQTTITQTWDYKVTSKVNTASSAPHLYDDDMQKFLNRWKD